MRKTRGASKNLMYKYNQFLDEYDRKKKTK